MKPELFNHEFNKIFKWYANESTPGSLRLELDFYKMLWNFFLIGDSFYFILNHHNMSIDYVSKEITDIMGYIPGEFNVPLMQESLHPEDRPAFLHLGSRVA